MTGIYMITNNISNKSYVGKSKDINARWKRHTSKLNQGNHINDSLQSDWDKYGEDNFTFKMIEVCKEEDLTARENYWIDILNVLKHGYNKSMSEKKAKHLKIEQEIRKN